MKDNFWEMGRAVGAVPALKFFDRIGGAMRHI